MAWRERFLLSSLQTNLSHFPFLSSLSPKMLSRSGHYVRQLIQPRLGVAAATFSSPAEDAAKKMTFNNKNITSKTKPNNVKEFKIYRWNPDTKGQTLDHSDCDSRMRKT